MEDWADKTVKHVVSLGLDRYEELIVITIIGAVRTAEKRGIAVDRDFIEEMIGGIDPGFEIDRS